MAKARPIPSENYLGHISTEVESALRKLGLEFDEIGFSNPPNTPQGLLERIETLSVQAKATRQDLDSLRGEVSRKDSLLLYCHVKEKETNQLVTSRENEICFLQKHCLVMEEAYEKWIADLTSLIPPELYATQIMKS